MAMEIRNIPKHELAVLQAHSLRELIEKVNGINFNSFEDGSKMILREDIVELVREDGTFFLLYYK